jgi:hypothetical protein
MRKQLLEGTPPLCLRPQWQIFLVLIIRLGVVFFLTGKLRFNSNFLKLFPAEKKPIKLYVENLKEEGIFGLYLEEGRKEVLRRKEKHGERQGL